jgi:hypothetical protein
MYFNATPDENGLMFAIHAFAFVLLGTLWFHLFGRPSLAGWIGHASQATLTRERDAFHAESNQDGG